LVLWVFRSHPANHARNLVVGFLLVLAAASLLMTSQSPESIESLTTAVSDAVSSVYPSYTSVNNTATAPVLEVIELTDICFVSSIYGKNSKGTDKPGDFRQFHLNNATSHKFFLYNNLPEIDAPGWIKIVTDLEYRRFITQSR
jgi:hypothetical protein